MPLVEFSFLFKNFKNNYAQLYQKYWRKPFWFAVVILLLSIPHIFIVAIRESVLYERTLTILTTILLSWILIQLTKTVKKILTYRVLHHYSNKLDAQSVNTQIAILAKIIIVTVVAIGVSLILMVFPQIRHLGISILASAGIAGIILGFAAQKSLGTILAGIQIAFTKPIKIGDEVLVENENGIIEKINLTHVVMCTYDKRRLIIPINYFIEKPFQNWTIHSPELVGVVCLEVDYTAPVQKIREALGKIVQETALWDGKIKTVQVTNSKDKTIELKILVSAADPTAAGDLKCYVREKLIEFLQNNYPECLPKMRVEVKDR